MHISTQKWNVYWYECFPRGPQRETYKLEATAQDKGYPPLSRSVEVQIDVVDRANNPPVWDHVVYGPIFIRENFPVGAKVVSVKARSVPSNATVVLLLRLSVLWLFFIFHLLFLLLKIDQCGAVRAAARQLHGTSRLFVHASPKKNRFF